MVISPLSFYFYNINSRLNVYLIDNSSCNLGAIEELGHLMNNIQLIM